MINRWSCERPPHQRLSKPLTTRATPSEAKLSTCAHSTSHRRAPRMPECAPESERRRHTRIFIPQGRTAAVVTDKSLRQGRYLNGRAVHASSESMAKPIVELVIRKAAQKRNHRRNRRAIKTFVETIQKEKASAEVCERINTKTFFF